MQRNKYWAASMEVWAAVVAYYKIYVVLQKGASDFTQFQRLGHHVSGIIMNSMRPWTVVSCWPFSEGPNGNTFGSTASTRSLFALCTDYPLG